MTGGGRDEPTCGLTPREREIAELIAAGLSNREIATQLVITEGTVEVHVKHILSKLNFKSRAQVTRWLVRTDEHRSGHGTRASVESNADARRNHNLPTDLSSFVGRQRELVEVKALLGAHRLVTLTGTGGAGKTRLASRAAAELLDAFPDGVWFTDLSSISNASLVPTIVLAAMGGRESTDELPVESLRRHLGGKTLLLMVDNCEHVIDACAGLLETLLGACPDLRVLTTSREALRVPGEVVWRVPSLTLPEPGDGVLAEVLLASEAVRLFVDRVRRLDQEFSLTTSNAASVADICRRLDGIPLAIELAAACASGLTVQEIAARLDNRFNLLTGGHRTAMMRHRTLRATIDWSHDLLSPAEQTLLRRLAVFAGGWTLEGAENVCGAAELERSEILHLLMRLIDQSLVNVDADAGHTRYRLLQTVRDYATERLEAAGETAELQARHRAWYLDFAERVAVGLKGPDRPEWFRLVTAEHDNIRAALDAYELDPTAAAYQLRLAAAMGRFWFPFHRLGAPGGDVPLMVWRNAEHPSGRAGCRQVENSTGTRMVDAQRPPADDCRRCRVFRSRVGVHRQIKQPTKRVPVWHHQRARLAIEPNAQLGQRG
jgi:non-specific serine/threonine protein kinase